MSADQTGIKLILQHRPVDTGADENNLLTSVAERLGPVIPDIVSEWRMVRPALFRDCCPPRTSGVVLDRAPASEKFGQPFGQVAIQK